MKTIKIAKYITVFVGVLMVTVGTQSCKNDEIHEVVSGMDYYLTLQSGDIIKASDVIKDKDLSDRFISSDDDIADYCYENIYATFPGIATLHNDKCTISVRVLPYTGPKLFPELPEINFVSADKNDVKNYMQNKGFTLTKESIETVNLSDFIVLEYAPFGNSKSITFYLKNSNWSYVCFAIIDTGKSVADNRGYLLQDYDLANNSGLIADRYFVEKNSYSYAGIYITSDDGWKTLKLMYR